MRPGARQLTLTAALALLMACEPPSGEKSPAPIVWSDVETSEVVELDAIADTGQDEEPVNFGLTLMTITGAAGELTTIHERFEEEIATDVDVVLGDRKWTGVQLELHGGFARSTPKKSYRLVFPDDDELTGDLFGDGKDHSHRRLVLQASWIDQSFIRNKLTMDLIRDLGGLAPRVGYMVLVMNGQWLGLYQCIERIDRPYLHRQSLDKDGNLYKAENHWANWQDKEDPLAGYDIQEGEDQPHDDLGELLAALTHTPTTTADFESEVEPRLELDDFLTWQMVHTLAMNEDTFTKNYYLYHDVDEEPGEAKDRFRIITWDADATWGNYWDGEVLEPTKEAWHGSDAFSPRLFSIPSYRESYLERYALALDGPLSPAVMRLRLAATSALISDAAQADLEHWDREHEFAAEIARLDDALSSRVEVMEAVVAAEIQDH